MIKELTNLKSVAIVAIICMWAIIYLPFLGLKDATRNECRRILPAERMLESGNWVTPMLRGEPYFRKPPMTNWFIAVAQYILGSRSLFVSRLPIALTTLAFAFFLFLYPTNLLSLKERFLASGVFLTTIGMFNHGRSAGIDPLYACFCGAAMLMWLNAWMARRSDWQLWIIPALPLAVAMLLKGPLALLFYYTLVVTLLFREKGSKKMISLWHILGVLTTILPFLVWSYYAKHNIPNASIGHASSGQGQMSVWMREISMRFNIHSISYGKWMEHVAGGVAQFLPWLFLFPLLWVKKIRLMFSDKQLVVMDGLRMSVCVICFS